MQAYSQTQPFGRQTHTQQKTTSSNAFIISPQVQYYIAQQRMARQQNTPQSHGLCHGQATPQTVSSSSNLQSREMPQGRVTDSQNQLHHKNTASTLPSGQFVSWPAAQHGAPTQNLSHHPQAMSRNPVPQTLNGNPQQNCNMPPMPRDAPASWLISAYSNRYSPTEQNNRTHQSVLPQCQSLNEHHHRSHIHHQPAAQLQQTDLSVQTVSNQTPQIHNQEQRRVGQENRASYSTVNHFPAQSQRLITSSHPSNSIHQSGQSPPAYNAHQVQHASQIQHHPLSNRIENTSASYNLEKLNGNMHPNQPSLPSYTSQHLIYISQSMHQSSALGLPQEQVQPQTQLQQRNTVQASCHRSKPYHTTTLASQGNPQSQKLQSNHTTTGPPSSCQRTISTSTPTRKAPVYTESSVNYSNVALKNLLMDNTQVPAQRYDINTVSCHKPSLATPEQTSSHVNTKASYSQTPESAPYHNAPAILKNSHELQRVTEYQSLVKRTPIATETEQNQLNVPDVQSSERMRNRRLQTDKETNDGCEGDNRQPTREMQYIEDTTEALELALALNNLFRQSNKAVAVVPPISQQVLSPENNDSVTISSDDSLLFKINAAKDNKNVEEEANASSLPKETIEEFVQLFSVLPPETQKHNRLEDGSTVESQTPNTQSTEVPPCKAGSTTSQSSVCSTVLTSKSPEDLNSGRTEKSDADALDLSKAQGVTLTLEKFNILVKLLERLPGGSVMEPVADFEKCLLDLYWAGNREELDKKINTFPAKLCDFLCEASTKEMETLQFLSHTYLERLERFCHILKHDKVVPTEEFRSSWLNVNGQPADIENVLAEPICELKLPDYVSLEGFENLDIYLESEPSTNMIPANTECQKDNMMTKESADHESKSTDQIPNTKEASNKQEDENLEKNQQQEENTTFEQSLHSAETEVILIESENTAECEQVYRDACENITSPSEGIELLDLSHDSDSSNDSQLIQISVLSSGDARAIYKECFGSDWQQQPSQLCQDVTKVSATPDESFCNSANQIKFTCPHVTDFERDGENFCPKCWEETPLLDLDLEEALFSPKCGSPKSPKQSDEQICSPPGSNSTALSERSNVTDAPPATVHVDKVTIFESDSNPSDKVESCSSGSSKSPVKEPHAPVSAESINFTLPIKKAACETNGSVVPELPKAMSHSLNAENLVIPEQNKTKRDTVSPPESPPCKKLKVVKITEVPANDLFIDMTTKASSTKKQPSTLGVIPAEDGQHCKDVRKERVEERKLPIKLKILLNVRCEQSGKPDPHVNVCSESSSDSANSSTSAVTTPTTKPDLNMPNSGQICRSPSGKPDSQMLTKTSREKVSPPSYPPCKKVKNTKVASLPSEDDLFAPDIVIKKASSPKSHLHDLLSFLNSTEDGQHSKDKSGKTMEWKKPSAKSQVPNVIHQQKSAAVVSSSEKNREKVEGTTKQTGQNKEIKQRFALYGYSNDNQNKIIHQHKCNKAKPATAPVYVTVADTSESSMNYTDTPSAKQKVYSQWSSTFVETQKKISSRKKNRKRAKEDLTSTTQTLKRILKDREAIRDGQMAKDAGDFVVDHKYKKFKRTIAKRTL